MALQPEAEKAEFLYVKVAASELEGSLNGTASYKLFPYTGALTDNVLAIDAAFTALHPTAYFDTTSVPGAFFLDVPEPGCWAFALGSLILCLGLRLRRN